MPIEAWVVPILLVGVGGGIVFFDAWRKRCPKCGSFSRDVTGGRPTGRRTRVAPGGSLSGLRGLPGSSAGYLDERDEVDYEYTCAKCGYVWPVDAE